MLTMKAWEFDDANEWTFAKVSIEQQANITQFASLHGIIAATCRFSEKLVFGILESSIRAWKAKYLAVIPEKCASGETASYLALSVVIRRQH